MIMDNSNDNTRTDINSLKKVLIRENLFIKNLLSILPIPSSDLSVDNESKDVNSVQNKKQISLKNQKKSRAQTLTELHDRLKSLQTKKLNYKDKLVKKGLKNRIKKKTKLENRKLTKKLTRIEKLKHAEIKTETDAEEVPKPSKPIFNKEGKMVFSKFDFSGIGEKRERKAEKDPKKILQNLEEQKEKLEKLVEKGEKDKVVEIKEKMAWKNAIAKAEGEKIKDDPLLLKKSIKKREQIRKGSQKKWQDRQEGVKKSQEARQAKRTENIAKRKKEVKTKKLKQAAKRGRIIPGF